MIDSGFGSDGRVHTIHEYLGDKVGLPEPEHPLGDYEIFYVKDIQRVCLLFDYL